MFIRCQHGKTLHLILAFLVKLLPKAAKSVHNFRIIFRRSRFSEQDAFLTSLAQPVACEENSIGLELLTHETLHCAITSVHRFFRPGNVCTGIPDSAWVTLASRVRAQPVNDLFVWRAPFLLTSFSGDCSPVPP